MTMKQTSKILVSLVALTVAALGLALYAYFGAFKKDAQEQLEKKPRILNVSDTEAHALDAGINVQFTKISLHFEGHTTQLERNASDEWHIVSPTKTKADQTVMAELVRQLESAQFKATLDENPNPEALKTYGLDHPQLVLSAEMRVGSTQGLQTLQLEGGRENTFDGSIYMRRNQEKAVYTAEGGVRYGLAKTLFDLREKQILSVPEKSIRRLNVKTARGAYALERDPLGQWKLSQPTQEPADARAISEMLSQFANEKAQAFLDDEAETAWLEKTSPMIDARYILDSAQEIHIALWRDATDAGGGSVVAFRQDSIGRVWARFNASATQLQRDPAELKDKTILRFRKEDVVKMLFHQSDGHEFVLAKDSPDASAESWKVLGASGGKAQIFKVTSLLWTLASLKAQSSAEPDSKKIGSLGINNSSRWIALFGVSGELARLTFGTSVPGKPNYFYVTGSNGSAVESDGSRFGEFPKSANEILDELSARADSGQSSVDK
jgi:Domain of unknown function (DUF4340)